MGNILARHSAVVTAINEDGTFEATIETSEACGSCSAKKLCGNDAQKSFTLVNEDPNRKAGDLITLVISRSMGFLAILLAYLIPVAIIIGGLFTFQHFGVDEIISGVAVLVLLAVYFIALRVLKKHIENQITITIE